MEVASREATREVVVLDDLEVKMGIEPELRNREGDVYSNGQLPFRAQLLQRLSLHRYDC